MLIYIFRLGYSFLVHGQLKIECVAYISNLGIPMAFAEYLGSSFLNYI